MLTVTVSQLNRYVKAVLEEDRKLRDLYIRGEVSNFTRHFRSGHLYFSLKDEGGAVKAVMFRSHAGDLRFEPENGMAVLVRASVGVYERDGVYQLYVTDIQPEGAGAMAVAFEQIKARLAAEGLFAPEHKKELPRWPRRVGVVTSETGAALRDIENVLSRRYPLCTLVLSPAVVQGREAPASLIRALRQLDKSGNCDVILLGRGGGSAEDLWCFNDEKLARAVFAAETPVVSAVGHEVDYTICDFVADLRAPTPSAAAELCTPSAEQFRQSLSGVRRQMAGNARRLLEQKNRRLAELSGRPALRTPMNYIQRNQERLDFLCQSLYNKKCIFIRDYSQRIAQRAMRLDSLSPLRVLDRGYCVALRDGRAVSCAGELLEGDVLALRFLDGTAETKVCSVTPDDQNGATDNGNKKAQDL